MTFKGKPLIYDDPEQPDDRAYLLDPDMDEEHRALLARLLAASIAQR